MYFASSFHAIYHPHSRNRSKKPATEPSPVVPLDPSPRSRSRSRSRRPEEEDDHTPFVPSQRLPGGGPQTSVRLPKPTHRPRSRFPTTTTGNGLPFLDEFDYTTAYAQRDVDLFRQQGGSNNIRETKAPDLATTTPRSSGHATSGSRDRKRKRTRFTPSFVDDMMMETTTFFPETLLTSMDHGWSTRENLGGRRRSRPTTTETSTEATSTGSGSR